MGLFSSVLKVGSSLLGGGGGSKKAAVKAAQIQADAAREGIAEQRRQYDLSRSDQMPWLQAGQGALGAQLDLLGLGGSGGSPGVVDWAAYVDSDPAIQAAFAAQSDPRAALAKRSPLLAAGADFTGYSLPGGADKAAFGQSYYNQYGGDISKFTTGGGGAVSADQAQQAAIANLQDSPLFQSLMDSGQEALLQSAAATGGLRGGNTVGRLANFGRDTLSQVIQQQLANLGGISSQGGATGAGLGALGANSANSISSLLQQSGSAQAGGILGAQGIQNAQNNSLLSGLASVGTDLGLDDTISKFFKGIF